MVNMPRPDEIDLETLLRSAGKSFTDAQKALVPDANVSVNMMLSNADLELKVVVRSDAAGKMTIRPISSEDISRGGIDAGMLSTVRISFVSSVGEITPQPSSARSPSQNAVPSVIGRTMDDATALLRSKGWPFEIHAAKTDSLEKAGIETRGRIVAQDPKPDTSSEGKVTVHLWVDLGRVSVKEIDGIAARREQALARSGITTIGELSLSGARQVASLLRVSETRAQEFIDMASLMSHLTIVGLRDEVVEVLVRGTGISSVKELADADPQELFEKCQGAVESGKIAVPREFKLNKEDVVTWVHAAGKYLGR